jgi:hypothetical protein
MNLSFLDEIVTDVVIVWEGVATGPDVVTDPDPDVVTDPGPDVVTATGVLTERT